MTVEDVKNSLKNQVDILCNDLAFLLVLYLVEMPEDYTEEVKLLLELEIAPLAKEAGSLNYSVLFNKMTNGKFKEKSILSTFWHKIKIIKAETFLLELHKQKADLMVSVGDRIAAIRVAMKCLVKNF
ncbi:hypothetical protein ACH5RR_026577 [Cinchona calisaya]|uniref:Uncharacterized protein n=1 Tax=Cinchona calisaya TaxID=153742 RepID=A0ABD2Z2Z8_9GENT